jgi:hypothetical protein
VKVKSIRTRYVCVCVCAWGVDGGVPARGGERETREDTESQRSQQREKEKTQKTKEKL